MDVISLSWPPLHRLGFGTAYLLDGRTRADAIRLLDCAIDEGVRYFDTARMYCGGMAEGVVGEVARRRGHKMFIATKAGLLPPSGSAAARAARKLSMRVGMAPPIFARPPAHQFRRDQLNASLETSLRELGTERIDLLLLHEIALSDVTDELFETLHALTSAGKVGAYGLATGRAETRTIAAAHPGRFAFAQVPDSLWDRREGPLNTGGIAVVGSHSIMGTPFADLRRRLAGDDQLLRQWSDALGFDAHDAGRLAKVFLAEALDANLAGPVLFSSGNANNIRANVKVLEGAADQPIAELRSLLASAQVPV